MWKYLGWPLAVAAFVGAYFVNQAAATREAEVQGQLWDAQQLTQQLSNRLAVVEAQFSNYKIIQEKEARERVLHERESAFRGPESAEKYPPAPAQEPSVEPEPVFKRDDTRGRRPASGKSFGEGVNSLLDRIRGGFGN